MGRNLHVWKTYQEGDAPLSRGLKLLCSGPPQTLSYVSLLLTVPLYPFTCFHKLVSVFSWILWDALVDNQIQGTGDHENLLWAAKSDRSCGYPGDLLLVIGVWRRAGAVLWDWALNLWGLTLSPGRWCQNWVKLWVAQLVSQNCLVWENKQTNTHLGTGTLGLLWMW